MKSRFFPVLFLVVGLLFGSLVLQQAQTSSGGTYRIRRAGGVVQVTSAGAVSIAPLSGQNATLTTGNLVFPNGTRLTDDAANTLALRNSTNAQTLRVYNTFTDASNYERAFFRWNANLLQIGTEAAGTGSTRTLQIFGGGAAQANITSSGFSFLNNITFGTDNTYDIGASAASRPRNYTGAGFVSVQNGSSYKIVMYSSGLGLSLSSDTPLVWSSTTSASGVADTGIVRALAGTVKVTNGSTGGGNIQIGSTTAKPTCDSTTRGTVAHVYGSAGVKDTVEVCAKDVADAYAWRVIY